MQHSEVITVKKVPGKGRGVFARRAIKKGELIEEVPVIVVPASAFEGDWDNESLTNYFFAWTDKTVAISLGYGALYNHSYDPNATFEFHYRTRRMSWHARRDIAKGEEITINYNHDVEDRTPMWFDMVQETPKRNGKAAKKSS